MTKLEKAIKLASYGYDLLDAYKHPDLRMHADKADKIIKSQCAVIVREGDLTVYALPGKEGVMLDKVLKMKKKRRPLRYRKPKTFRCDL